MSHWVLPSHCTCTYIICSLIDKLEEDELCVDVSSDAFEHDRRTCRKTTRVNSGAFDRILR